MANLEIAGLLILVMFVILGSGVWIGLALLATGWLAMELFERMTTKIGSRPMASRTSHQRPRVSYGYL